MEFKEICESRFFIGFKDQERKRGKGKKKEGDRSMYFITSVHFFGYIVSPLRVQWFHYKHIQISRSVFILFKKYPYLSLATENTIIFLIPNVIVHRVNNSK